MTVLYFLIPIIAWLIFAKFWLHHKFTVKEMAAQGVLTVVVLVTLFTVSDYAQMGSTKIVNGEVTKLNPLRQSCPMGWVSYKDGHCTHYVTREVKIGQSCRTNDSGREVCTDITRTEYNYIYAWERRYFVESSVPKTFEITRVDRQGVNTPPRFASITLGDPVAVEVTYLNPIKGAAHSLLRASAAEPIEMRYPRVHDYYNVQRVMAFGDMTPQTDLRAWSRQLDAVNRDVRGTGANVIILLTGEPEEFAERLAKTWHAHNINDLVISIGVDTDGRTVRWAEARSWSATSRVNYEIRDAILNIGALDPDAINAEVQDAVTQYYELQDIKAFDYLKDDISLPIVTLILAFLVLLVFTPLITFYFSRHVDWR